MIRRARHYLQTDEPSLGTAMRDRDEQTGPAAPVLHEFFCEPRERDYGSEVCDLFPVRRVSSRAPSPLSSRLFVDPTVSLLVSFLLIPLSSRGHSLTFSSPFFLLLASIHLPSRSQEGLEVRRVKGGCDLLAPSVRSTTYDFRRQDSGPALPEIVWSDWKPKWIFPGISGVSCIRNNINGRDSSRNHSALVNLFSIEFPTDGRRN